MAPRAEYVKLGVTGVGLCERARIGHWAEVPAGFTRVAP
ncbi:hypothetical protein EV652_110223 [Kribbella steppae]|uniref:Uncharacterized protein n=1 Tax=Kribbella steppae TaxID=2512223 RepID=A0A4R2H7P1_9ACTN|nr:hypothetical protein EV652_110223 [Kribbella steppae]